MRFTCFNKHILVTIALAFLFCFSAKSQITYISSLDNHREIYTDGAISFDKVSLTISLDGKNGYKLVLNCVSIGMFDDTYADWRLSYGICNVEGDKMFLTDSIFGFIMELEIQNDSTLNTVKGIDIMNGKKFYYKGTNGFPSYSIHNDIQRKEIDDCHKIQTDYNVHFGVYQNRKGGTFKLVLLRNGRYEYSLDGILISKGSWEEDGNLLLLQDETLGQMMFATFEMDGKITNCLPGNVRRLSFEKITTE